MMKYADKIRMITYVVCTSRTNRNIDIRTLANKAVNTLNQLWMTFYYCTSKMMFRGKANRMSELERRLWRHTRLVHCEIRYNRGIMQEGGSTWIRSMCNYYSGHYRPELLLSAILTYSFKRVACLISDTDWWLVLNFLINLSTYSVRNTFVLYVTTGDRP